MKPFKALVIDDSRVMRAMVAKALVAAGLGEFEFVEAADGAEALAKFDPAEIDICLVDWNMPTMSGVEFVRRARARGDCSHTPMVMVTSEQTAARIEEALTSAGADAFVCKPFTPEALRLKLQRIVGRMAAAREKKPAAGELFSGLFG
jgi:two-component system chemotaxis response regulator CheY